MSRRAYPVHNWWAEIAIGVAVSVVATLMLITLWASSGGESVNLLFFLVPGIAFGARAANQYRNRHLARAAA
ncbi:hypothetical protein [Streptomyces bohaiensis]|uniref:hypothetical protein n=1 Tax=Streptomyces bohaiensis TaxID=1431344 RepID=UPI003B81BB49